MLPYTVMIGHLLERGAVEGEGDVLGLSREGGVVRAEEDGHEADVGCMVRRRLGGKEELEGGEGGGGVVAAEAPVDDVESTGVVVGEAGEDGGVAGLREGVSEEDQLWVCLRGGGSCPWLGQG